MNKAMEDIGARMYQPTYMREKPIQSNFEMEKLTTERFYLGRAGSVMRLSRKSSIDRS